MGKQKKKERDRNVYIGYKDKFKGISVENGKIKVILEDGQFVEPDSVISRTEYKRKSGKDKVTFSIPNGATFVEPLYLSQQFDAIWALDTNVKIIDGIKIAVCSIHESYIIPIKQDYLEFKFRKNGNIIFRNNTEIHEEKIALAKLIAGLSNKYRNHERIGIVSDHALGHHYAYNNHKSPIINSIYLPSNMTILYASSDSGTDSLLNVLIRKCDKDANAILNDIRNRGGLYDQGQFKHTQEFPIVTNQSLSKMKI